MCRWDCARRCGERVLVGVRVRGGVGWEMGGARGGCGNHGDCSGNGFISAASGGGGAHGSQGGGWRCTSAQNGRCAASPLCGEVPPSSLWCIAIMPGSKSRGRFRMDTLDISRAFLVLSWSFFVLRTENFLG